MTGPRQGIGLLKVAALLAVLLLLGGGGFFAWSKLGAEDTEGEQKPAEQTEQEEEPVVTETLSLGEFLVNLRSGDGTLRYLQTEVSIVVASPENQEAEGEDHGHGSAGSEEEAAELPPASHRYARDVAIEVLSSQSFERLRDQTDRSKLKATLQQKLDAALHGCEVRDVLFTRFVMQ